MIEFAACRREHAAMAEELAPLAARVLASGQMLQGHEVERLEGALATTCGRRHVICVGSGTDALVFGLMALGIGPGDEVLVPDVSFIATASAVARTGASPVFVDVDQGCLIDLHRAAEAVTPRTRAVLVVQLFGAMANPEQLRTFAAAHRLHIVEDAAQAFGATFADAPAGSIGEISALSFDPMKVLSAPGSGGAVLTDCDAMAARIRRLRYHGREDGRYVEVGFNSQLPSLAAAVLSAKLVRHPGWRSRRQEIAARYTAALAQLPLEQPAVDPQVTHTWHKFVVRLEQRDALAGHLKALGAPTMVHYPRPFHRESLFGERSDGDFPRACAHADRALSLPIHAQLTDEEVERVIAGVRSFFGWS